jgi:MFS transporter
VSAVSAVNVALPDLARATGASTTELRWIVDAYALVFAGLLLLAGAVGDRFGRGSVLLAGLAVFGGGVLVATQFSDPGALIAVRAVMGVGAAMILPTTLSIITGAFSDEARDRAVGVWAGVAGGSALVGLLASGLLLEWFHWSSVFGLNAALAAVGGAMTLRFVPRSTPEAGAARPGRRGARVARPRRPRLGLYRGPKPRRDRGAGACGVRRRRRVARRVHAVGAAPRAAEARPAPVPAARLLGRLAVRVRPVLRDVRDDLRRPAVPAVRASLLAVGGGRRARADRAADGGPGSARSAPGRAGRRPPRRFGRPGADRRRPSRRLDDGRPAPPTGICSAHWSCSASGWRSRPRRPPPRSSSRCPTRSKASPRPSTTPRARAAARSGIAVLGSVRANHVGHLGPMTDPQSLVDG